MSNQDKLLSDEELNNELRQLLSENTVHLPHSKVITNRLKKITHLINTQKRLYALEIIGEDELEGVSDANHSVYAGAEYRNQLRAEQRGKIK